MKKILIVDDSLAMCDEVSEVLRDEGYMVNCANNGTIAYEELSTSPYDLVLLDLKMPILNGFELLRKLRETNNSIKIVVITAHPVMSDLLAQEGGLSDEDRETLKLAEGLINKPYEIPQLLRMIDTVIHT